MRQVPPDRIGGLLERSKAGCAAVHELLNAVHAIPFEARCHVDQNHAPCDRLLLRRLDEERSDPTQRCADQDRLPVELRDDLLQVLDVIEDMVLAHVSPAALAVAAVVHGDRVEAVLR